MTVSVNFVIYSASSLLWLLLISRLVLLTTTSAVEVAGFTGAAETASATAGKKSYFNTTMNITTIIEHILEENSNQWHRMASGKEMCNRFNEENNATWTELNRFTTQCVNTKWKVQELSVSQITFKKDTTEKEKAAKTKRQKQRLKEKQKLKEKEKEKQATNGTDMNTVVDGATTAYDDSNATVVATTDGKDDRENENDLDDDDGTRMQEYLVFAIVLPWHPYSSELMQTLTTVGPLFPEISFVMGNGYHFHELVAKYQVKAFPGLLFFRKGKFKQMYKGTMTVHALVTQLVLWGNRMPVSKPYFGSYGDPYCTGASSGALIHRPQQQLLPPPHRDYALLDTSDSPDAHLHRWMPTTATATATAAVSKNGTMPEAIPAAAAAAAQGTATASSTDTTYTHWLTGCDMVLIIHPLGAKARAARGTGVEGTVLGMWLSELSRCRVNSTVIARRVWYRLPGNGPAVEPAVGLVNRHFSLEFEQLLYAVASIYTALRVVQFLASEADKRLRDQMVGRVDIIDPAAVPGAP